MIVLVVTKGVYTTQGPPPRASAAAASFFREWMDDLIGIVHTQRRGSPTPEEFDAALQDYERAREVYDKKARQVDP